VKTIAVTGASGHLGRLVLERLKKRGSEPIALTRNVFDYGKPETLKPALDGVATLLLISSNEVGVRKQQHRNVIAAAKEAGVDWIVYTSILHADTSIVPILGEEHRDTEQAIRDSGIPYTFLRNSWYLENYTSRIQAAVAHGALIGSAGDGSVSAASRGDYADAAAAVLTTGGHAGKIYELGGDSAFTMSDLAAEISKQTGKTIPYDNISEDAFAVALERAGLPPIIARMLAGSDTATSKGALFDDGHQLSALIGHPTTPLSAAVMEALKT
jgi:NAD(P)H dehydrogenase (quinone)